MPKPSQETEMAAEIERLRGEFPKTQDLYREVCVLLFFRYGMGRIGKTEKIGR